MQPFQHTRGLTGVWRRALPSLMLLSAGVALTLPPSGCRRTPKGAVTTLRIGEKAADSRLLRGFYEPLGGWRWTAPSFALSLDAPHEKVKTFLILDCTIPTELMAAEPSVTLTARVNGVETGRQTYSHEGRYIFSREVPPEALKRSPAEVECTVDQTAAGSPAGQPRGLIAVSAGLVPESEEPGHRAKLVETAQAEYRRIYGNPARGMTLKQDKSLKAFFHETPIWENLRFHGIPIIQSPLDLWMTQQILFEVRPDFVIETGTYRGGSSLWLAHTLEGLGLDNSRVLTIDIGDYCRPASTQALWKKYVEFIFGSSTDPHLVARIGNRVRGK